MPELAPMFRPALERLAEAIVGAGSMTRDELHAVIADFEEAPDPPTADTTILVSARRPLDPE